VQRVLFVVNQLQDASHRPDDMDWSSARYFRYQFYRMAGLDAGSPPGPDAAEPGPDATIEATPDAAPIATADAGSTTGDAGSQLDTARGCGCATSGGALAVGALSLLGLALPRRRREGGKRTAQL
jgi:MYXO-CTERM domain-containing protein